jgi:hypothetical protein
MAPSPNLRVAVQCVGEALAERESMSMEKRRTYTEIS